MKPSASAQEPLDSFEVDNVRIGYNPPLNTSGVPTPQSLVFHFHTKRGWLRMSLQADVCHLFDKRYRDHTEGRLK